MPEIVHCRSWQGRWDICCGVNILRCLGMDTLPTWCHVAKYFASKLKKIMEENYSLYFHYEIFILWFAVWGRFLFCKAQFVLVFTFFSLMVNCEEAEEKGYWLPSNVKINIRTLFEMLFSSHFAYNLSWNALKFNYFRLSSFYFLVWILKLHLR